MLKMLKKCNAEASVEITDSTLIKERVVICSVLTIEVFRNHLQQQGALGLLTLPFVSREVRKCLTENKLV